MPLCRAGEHTQQPVYMGDMPHRRLKYCEIKMLVSTGKYIWYWRGRRAAAQSALIKPFQIEGIKMKRTDNSLASPFCLTADACRASLWPRESDESS